jgi:hypothetical protein
MVALQGCLDVGKRRATSASGRSGGKSRSYSRHALSLVARRDELVSEIALLRSVKQPSPFLSKAETLLTRYWAGANWQAREEILRGVNWLLNLARLPSAGPAAQARTRRSPKRQRRAPLGA